MFFLSSRCHLMSGCGVPDALHTSDALWFSRTDTIDGELSASKMFGGTEAQKHATH
jgi:hypothetical protein